MKVKIRIFSLKTLALTIFMTILICLLLTPSHASQQIIESERKLNLPIIETAKTLEPDEKLIVWVDINATVDCFGDYYLPADPSLYGIKWVIITFAPSIGESNLFWCLAEVEAQNIEELIKIPWVANVTLVRVGGLDPQVYAGSKLTFGLNEAMDRALECNGNLEVIAWMQNSPSSAEIHACSEGIKNEVIDNVTTTIEQFGGKLLRNHCNGSSTLLATFSPENVARIAENPFIKKLYLNGPVIFYGSDNTARLYGSGKIETSIGPYLGGSGVLLSVAFFGVTMFDKKTRKKLLAFLCVAAVLSLTFMSQMMPSVQALNVSTSAINADDVWATGNRGGGVNVAVIDSGIDLGHQDFQNAIVDQVNIEDYINNEQDTSNVQDTKGHGTHVAGIVAGRGVNNPIYTGVAPEAGLVIVKATDNDQLEPAVRWVIDHRAADNIRVIQSSVGPGFGFGSPIYGDGLEHPYATALDDAVENGIVVVQAAGNEGPTPQTIVCPGDAFNVITVGAVDDNNTSDIHDDILAGDSSRGPTWDGVSKQRPKPDVVAPGVHIWSCRASGIPADQYEDVSPDGFYGEQSGTSMAAPHVSGTVALMLHENPNLTPAQVKAILRQSARLNDNLEGLTVNDRGYGIIDAHAAVLHAYFAPYLIDMNHMYDSYNVSTPARGLGLFCYDYMTFTVDAPSSTFGVSTSNIEYHYRGFLGNGNLDFSLLKQLSAQYVWIDGERYDFGFEMSQYLFSGPRIYAADAGCVVIRAIYKVDNIFVYYYWYMHVDEILQWLVITDGPPWKTIMYVDPNVGDNSNNYAYLPLTSEHVCYERKITGLTHIDVRDPGSNEYIQNEMASGGNPVWWILRHGYVGYNPDDALNNEYIYNRDIVIYYQVDGDVPGICISRLSSPEPNPPCLVNAVDLNGTEIFTGAGDVKIDGCYRGPTNSIFDVASGTHNVSVNAFWDTSTGYRWGFQNWADGSTGNPRNITVTGDMPITAHFKKKYCPGDLNDDGIIDIFDIATVAVSFGAIPGNSGWDSRADIVKDNIIDIFDISICAINFNQMPPSPPPGFAGAATACEGAATSEESTALADATTSVSVCPSQVTVGKGESFSVNVTITNATNLYGFEYKLVWNKTLVKYSSRKLNMPSIWRHWSEEEGKWIDDYTIVKNVIQSNETHQWHWLAISALAPAPAFTGNWTFCEYTFQALAAGTSALSLQAKLCNMEVEAIPVALVDGSVTVYNMHYMRGDQQTVNGLTAYQLAEEQSNITKYASISAQGSPTVYWGMKVWVRHENGTETEITAGTPAAVVSRVSSGQGIQYAYWNCPETSLTATDAIIARVYMKIGSGSWSQKSTFTTEQLNATKLEQATWTVYYYTKKTYTPEYHGPGSTNGRFYWGTETYNSHIEGLKYA